MNRISPIVFFGILALVLASVLFGVYLGKNYSIKTANVNSTVSPFINEAKVTGKCPSYQYSGRDDYLITYTVNKGDTLLYIAKKQLGDSSRVNELINLNKDNYPQLSMSNTFLEQGWKLYLPPKNMPISSGLIVEINGELTQKFNDTWVIRGPLWVSQIQVTKETKISNKDIPISSCLKVIREMGAEGKAIVIEFQ